jgi:hypothetical protein
MATARRSNDSLRWLLRETGWTGEAFARSVNQIAAESGVTLRYDRTTVSHWLAGTRPRPPAPDLIAEAFTRRLGRQVTAADAGLAPQPDAAGWQATAGDPAAMLAALGTDAAASRRTRRGRPDSTPYCLDALKVPGLTAPGPMRPALGASDSGLVSAEVVTAAQEIGRSFSANDISFGGGSVRRALSAYLKHHLAPRLSAPGKSATRRQLFKVTAELAYLCAFTYFDDELNGAGQQYYLSSLRLAAEIGDQVTYSVALRAMSLQAQRLGHNREAVHLAETAAATGRAGGKMHQAFVYGQLAVACAADGDRLNAFASLQAAERRMEAATSSALVGAYHAASLAHTEAVVRGLLGDNRGAATALTESIRYRPASERRARALTLASLAELHLRMGALDEAVARWHSFLDDYLYLTSGRADTALRSMRATLRPYSRNPGTRTLLARSTPLALYQMTVPVQRGSGLAAGSTTGSTGARDGLTAEQPWRP